MALKILVYQLHQAHSRGTQISVLTGNLEIKALTKFTFYQTLCLSVKCSIGMHGLLQKAGTRRLPWLLIDAQLADRHYSMLPHHQSHLNHRGEKSRKNSLGGAEDHSGASAICFFFPLRGALFHLSFPPYGWSCHWTKSLGAFINVESYVGIFLKLYWRFFPFLGVFF